MKCVDGVVMPKGFLIKRHDDMSGIVESLYRPWSEVSHQEEPVDFSLRSTKHEVQEHRSTVIEDRNDRSRRHSDSNNRLLVRTPDSGFSSPSDNEAYRRSVIFPSVRQYLSQISESLHVDTEQTVPLALTKKREVEHSLYSSYSDEEHGNDSHSFHSHTPKSDDSRYLLSPPATNNFPLLSPSVYWPHGSSPLRSPIPFTSPLGRSYDIGFQAMTSLSSPQESINLSNGTHNFSTPSKHNKSQSTNITPTKRKSPSTNITPEKKSKSHKKTKASRRLNFDDEKTSPVSGTIIRELVEGEEPLVVRKGDIDPAYNVVEITEEAKTELAKIDNKIGEYLCRLCKELYEDAFGLAQHRCSRIIHVEYRCPECDKVFNCPANLASHRRWHKPKGGASTSGASKNLSLNSPSCSNSNKKDLDDSHDDIETNKNVSHDSNNEIQLQQNSSLMSLTALPSVSKDDSDEDQYECTICTKKFKRQAYLRKHLATHCDAFDSDQLAQYPPERPLLPLHHPPHSPLTPILSPTYSGEMVGCRLCSAAFFTTAALQLHVTTAHNTTTSEGDCPSLAGIHIPRPQYSPRAHILTPPSATHLLHRPPPLSAPS